MSDRTAAEVFCEVFTYLASQPQTPERDTFAARMFDLSGGFDFSPYQMSADKPLIALGLAKRVKGKGLLYKGEF